LEILETRRLDEPAKEFLVKPAPTNPTKGQSLCPDSPKVWICECEYALHKKYKILDNTKEGNGNYRICWNLNVEFNSIQ
jgi:hypothetical protein